MVSFVDAFQVFTNFIYFVKFLVKSKKSSFPVTRVKNPEPLKDSPDWIIWAAWADRITFEEIRKVTGLSEGHVIQFMRKSIKPASFRRWRKRASTQSLKHRKLFSQRRKSFHQYKTI
ncbi:MAG: TIGR03643 family protein [Opitutae bacterium]|nr:TIGR03643 family protein [Opitutae bacterium]MBT4666889.1 TIGR03643 family protein [Opitutae bacterium]MBT5908986.1 TIGR03643 family protein [Opitutae bacterium]MBT6852108.1 TIGR03643 family protein [Opitutae bacterium]MBT7742164.1 TIGR03643 family protein [Opitutae bacterium]